MTWAETRPSSAPWLWRLKHLQVPRKKEGLAGRRQTRRAAQGQRGGQTTTKAQPQPSDPTSNPSFLLTTRVLSPQPRKVLERTLCRVTDPRWSLGHAALFSEGLDRAQEELGREGHLGVQW